METFILAEKETIMEAEIVGEGPDGAGRPEIKRDIIKEVIRSYDSRSRANEDLELLESLHHGRRFEVIEIAHVD